MAVLLVIHIGPTDLFAAPPGNDDFAAAQQITQLDFVYNGTNVDSTLETGELDHLGQASNSVWWKVTSPQDAVLIISTAGSDFDTVLAVYTGTSVDSLTYIASNDDFGEYPTSQTTVTVISGTQYFIVVDGFSDDQGLIDLTVSEIDPGSLPENDNFADAETITSLDTVYIGTNLGATAEAGEPDPEDELSNSAWWVWTAPENGSFAVSTSGSDFDTVLAVYTGTTLPDLDLVSSNDDYDDSTSQVVFSAVSGTVYFIAVDGYSGDQGSISVEISEIDPGSLPANDNLSNAVTITSLNTDYNGTNVYATVEPGEPDHEGERSNSVWWKWAASQSGYFIISTAGSDFDTVLSVYTGSSVDALNHVAGNNDVGGFYGTSRLYLPAASGTEYSIAVDGDFSDQGEITLQISYFGPITTAINDDFVNAINISEVNISYNGTNLGATFEPNEPNHEDSGSNSVWWRWTAPEDGAVTISTSLPETDFDTVLAVYSGSTLSNLTLIISNDDSHFVDGGSQATFLVGSGTEYFIAIDGKDNGTGSVAFEIGPITVPPVNDNFFDAIEIADFTVSYTGTNVNATEEPGEPSHDSFVTNSVWWKFTAPADDILVISSYGSEWDNMIAAYTGSSVDNLSPVDSESQYLVIPVSAGSEYFIAVDGDFGNQGAVVLSIKSLPVNDDLIDAIPLSGVDFSVSGHNMGATTEPDEPCCEHSTVWWKWTAPASGEMTFSTVGSNFDTKLATYTGTTINDLVLVDSNDNYTIDYLLNGSSQITFNAIAGTEYLIKVGTNYWAGDIILNSFDHETFFLKQAISSLKVSAGREADYQILMDINDDRGIGTEEAIEALRNRDSVQPQLPQ